MTLKTRLKRLETTRRTNDKARNPNAPRSFLDIIGDAMGQPLPPGVTFAHILAAADGSDPPPPDDDGYMPPNVIDVESAFLKITGDRDGWKARQLFLKRDLVEMIRQAWPTIDEVAGDIAGG